MAVLLVACGASVGYAQTKQPPPKQEPAKQEPAKQDKDKFNLLDLIEKSGYRYAKVSEGVYEIPATGKTVKEFPLRVVQADDLLLVIARLADRKSLTLNGALTIKLLELNDDYDIVKFALSEDMLYARIDIHVRLVDVPELKYLIEVMAQIYDEAYPHIKPFVLPVK
jgi:hypothetical protein